MRVLYDDIEFDDAPMECMRFFSARRAADLEIDTARGGRVVFEFSSVVAIRFAPMFDRRPIMVDGSYRRTLLVDDGSQWLSALRDSYAAAEESAPGSLEHYLVPSDDGVWEIVARGVRVSEVGA